MKTPKLIRTLTLTATLGALLLTGCGKKELQPVTPEASLRAFAIGVAPNLKPEDREKLLKEVGTLVLEGAAPGDNIRVFDALQLREIAHFEIPNEAVMRGNPGARMRRLAAPFAALQHYLKAEPPPGCAEGRILEPQAVELAATLFRRPGKPLTVVLVGAATYVHPTDPTWDFLPGDRWPSDGHVPATRAKTPFGVVDPKALKGVTIYHAYLRESFGSEAYRAALTRWWSLWASSQKGVLCTLTADLHVAMSAAQAGLARPLQAVTADPNDSKVLMHQARRPEAAEQDWILSEKVASPRGGLMGPIVQKLKLGIRWRALADFDLYTLPAPKSAELSYANPRTAEGLHEKDFASAPAGINGFETIIFSRPVDLRQVRASINLYSGEVSKGTEVDLRMDCDGVIFSKTVKIAATRGNQGGNAARRATDAHWVTLNLPEIAGLPPVAPGPLSH